MKQLFIFVIAFTWKAIAFAQVNMIQPADLQMAAGKWTGTLTYLDYTRLKEVTIPCNQEVSVLREGKELQMTFIYPDEPKYGSTDRLRISGDGRRLDDAEVIEKTFLTDGTLRLVIEERGKDDRKPATIRKIILLNKDKFSITKMVRFDNGTDFFRRNVYEWKKS